MKALGRLSAGRWAMRIVRQPGGVPTLTFPNSGEIAAGWA